MTPDSRFHGTALCAVLFFSATAAWSDPTVLWQIGTFDESSHEFHQGIPAADPVFTVGKSDPARDWYASQPGTSNGVAGFRTHPFTVHFDLAQEPRGLYTLKLAVLAYSPRLSILEVSVNGKRGQFFQHPILNYGAGNSAGHFQPEYSMSSFAIDIPGTALQRGANTLVLTAVDVPGGRNDAIGAVGTSGASQINYDALALENDAARHYASEAVSAEIVPTIFYKSRGGGLVEMVDVLVRYNEAPQKGSVRLAIGSGQFTGELAAGTDFGEQRIRFEVPEFSSPATARATVSLNGRARQFTAEVKPGKKWNVFVVPHEHLDIGYTDYQPKVAEVQSRAIDEAMDMIRDHPDFRYTLDGSWVAEQFLEGRSDQQRRRFMDLIRDKKIFVPANYSANYTGVSSLENLLRSLYYSHELLRANAGDFDHAIITDIPSHSWSLPSLLASAGLKYLVLPANNDLGPILLLGHLHERAPFWWEGPDGKRILLWYSRHYHQAASMFGLPPKVISVEDNLPTFLQIYTRPDYTSDGVIVFGTQWENTDLYREQATLAGDWNHLYAYPKLKFTGVSEAMGYIAGQMGESLPVIRGDGGPYWDVFVTGNPYYTALARENEHRILSAEKFSTVSSLVNSRIHPDRQALDQVWKGLIACEEHTFNGGRDPALRTLLSKADEDVGNTRLLDDVLMRATSALADSIQVPTGSLVVFNPLNWSRSKLVEFELARNQQLIDAATNKPIAVEELPRAAAAAGSRGGASRRVRFMATGVPAMGYRSYTISQAAQAPPPPAANTNTVLESPFYRVTLDPSTGAIRSVFDKELNRELADSSSPYRFGQYLDVTGNQDSRNRSALSTKIVPPPDLTVHPSNGGRLVSVVNTPFGSVARLESSAPNTPRIATEIILLNGQKRIEITNRLDKTAPSTGEWGYFAFPFAMDRPQFRYEIQNGVVNPAKDTLPGGSREWQTVQHWAAVDQDGVTAAVVPVDAPLVAFGDIIRYRWPKEFGDRKGVIFSHVLERSAPGPELTFRYVLTSGRELSPGVLSRIGWDAMSPFELDELVAEDKVGNPARPLSAAQGSFLDVDQPGVVLVTWKLAEDGKGTIMRFVETNGQPAEVKVKTPLLKFESAWIANSVEENQRPLAVSPGGFSFSIKPFEVVTVRAAGTPLLK